MNGKAMISRLGSWVALAVLVAVVLAAGFHYLGKKGHGVGGPFHLVNQLGQPTTDADFRGRLMVIYFGYTFCPDVCPTALSVMADAYEQLPPDQRSSVALIFITVDPERDDWQHMADYLTNFAPGMVGLTGPRADVENAMRAYKVYAKRGSGEYYSVDHSSIIYLMGKDGRFVAHFTHQNTAAELAGAIGKALGS